MTDDEIQKTALRVATALPKAELCYPFGEDVLVFKIMNKIFLLTSTLNGSKLINLKVEPLAMAVHPDSELYSSSTI